MARLSAWIGIALLALYLVFFGGGWNGLYRGDLRLISVVLAALTLLVWAVVAIRRPDWRPRSALLPAIIVGLVSLAISTEFSRFRPESLEYFGYAIILAALYLLLVRLLAQPFFRVRMGTLVVALAFVLAIAYAGANIAHWIAWWGLIGRFAIPPLRPESESLTFGNPSAVMTIVVLLATSAIAIVGVGSKGRILVAVVLAVLAAFTILVSGSRAGWLAVGIAILAMLVLLAADVGRRRQAVELVRGWTTTPRSRLALGAIAVGGIGAIAILAPVIIRRATDSGGDLRLNYVLAAQRMFAESPLFGTGPGTWVIQRIRYTLASETDYYIPHAHNIYAQTAAELGVIGLAAGLFLAVGLVLVVRGGLIDPDAQRRRWGWAAAFGLTYFAAHQLLDFYLNMPAILFAAALPVAWLDATATAPISIARRPLPVNLGRPAALVASILVVIASAGLIRNEVAAGHEARAVDLANAGQWVLADDAARDVAVTDPDWSPYQMTMGLTAANLGDHARAAAAFRRVAQSDDLPEAWLDLAAEEALLGRQAEAKDALTRAARLGLQRTAIAMAIGDLADRLGDTQLSDQAFSAAIVQVPSLAGDPWWLADPTRKQQLPRLIDAAIAATSLGDQWPIALMAGDVAGAHRLVPAASYLPGSLVPEDVIDAWAGDDAAFQRILAACEAHPLDGVALGWAARLEARRGDEVAANRYRQWAYEGQPDATSAGTELRVSDKPMIGRTAQGGIAEFWGAYTYRRFTPWNLLVPSVVQLTVQ